MDWFNYYGLIAVAIILIPNILFAFTHKEDFENAYQNKLIAISEQIGRYGCMAFMIINIPYVTIGAWFENALCVYLVVNGTAVTLYSILWCVYWKKNCFLKALSLSVLPSVVFIFSGIMLLNLPLIAFSVLFSFSHITISLKNVRK